MHRVRRVTASQSCCVNKNVYEYCDAAAGFHPSVCRRSSPARARGVSPPTTSKTTDDRVNDVGGEERQKAICRGIRIRL